MTREEAIILIERAANELREMMKTITMPTSVAEQLRQEIDAHEIAISALRQQDVPDTDVGKSEPLTMDELREAAETGDPVWLVGAYRTDSWVVIERVIDDAIHQVDYAELGSDEPFYFKISDYGDLLKAYRHKPEEDTV